MWAHNNPAPQRCHKKSRGGCKACKLRKVKCDEKKQICGKCVVHFSNITACDYGPAPKAKPNAKRIPIPDVTAPSQDLNELEPENNHTAAPGARNVSQASNESSAPLSSLSYRIPRGFERLLSEDAEERRTYRDCTCSYHQPEYTYMMLDAILGICRICGNQPRPGKSIYECCPVLSDAMLLTGRVDLFSILPAKSSPRVHALMHHCTFTSCNFNSMLLVSSRDQYTCALSHEDT
ncbi:hypothetical protein BDZ45DRAFT_276268 [Acephala macrosclerotiorum]|nr:hypothetical protein BDZ45DRAFT_276268 [Acephala macrosclerotiorum]